MSFRRRHRPSPRNPFSGMTAGGERFALTKLGYATGRPLTIEVGPVGQDFNETRPQFAVEATGARGTNELVFDADSTC